jgi:large subunit ribosomal protein L22
MRLVANIVKGMPIQKAIDTLNFTPRIAAGHIAKTLKSAAANALSQEGSAHIRPEDLHIKLITVDEAPTAKRIRFQSMGRVFRYRKRFSHLTVVLEERSSVKHEGAPSGTKAKKAEADATPGAKSAKGAGRASTKAPAKKAAAGKTAKKAASKKSK